MFCKLSLVTALAACIASAVSVDTDFRLWAYGIEERPGLPLLYGDGQAYIGGAPSYVKETANLTLYKNETSGEIMGKADSALNWTSMPKLYIGPTEGTANPVGFANTSETLPSGATTTGFGLYGGWLFHQDDSSTIEMKFVAQSTNETGIYSVMWNAADTTPTDDIPIALRTQAPVVLSD